VALACPCNLWRASPRGTESLSWKDADRSSNSLLPPVKYNSRAHSRLDNPRSLCMKTYYAPGNVSARSRPPFALFARASERPVGPETHCRSVAPFLSTLLFSVRHDKSNYTFKLRYTILSPFSSSSPFVRMYVRSFFSAFLPGCRARSMFSSSRILLNFPNTSPTRSRSLFPIVFIQILRRSSCYLVFWILFHKTEGLAMTAEGRYPTIREQRKYFRTQINILCLMLQI